MRTLAEAVEEFKGLENEAQAALDRLHGHPGETLVMCEPTLIVQLLEVAYSALWSCEEYQNRMRVAVTALTEGAVERPAPPDEGPSTTEPS